MEISPRSLRIGNYLSEGKVVEIGEDYFRIKDDNGCMFQAIDSNPIQLTSEWLLKFGFTEVNTPTFENIKLKYYCKDAVCLFFNGSPPENTYLTGHGFNVGRDYYASTAKWIDSVHELMNYYYAITGKELTIQEKQIEPPMMGMSY